MAWLHPSHMVFLGAHLSARLGSSLAPEGRSSFFPVVHFARFFGLGQSNRLCCESVVNLEIKLALTRLPSGIIGVQGIPVELWQFAHDLSWLETTIKELEHSLAYG